MRVAIFGTKGDPTQFLHLALPEQAWSQHAMDVVEIVLAGTPVDKKTGVTDKEVRFALLQAAVADNDHFKPSRVEMDREGPSYMVETLLHYRTVYGPDAELFLIIGADRAPTIHTWHRADELIKLCTILVGPRDGQAVSEEWLKQVLPAGAKFGVIELNQSSTFIRKCRANGWSIRYLVPDCVRDEIIARGLYLPETAAAEPAPTSDSNPQPVTAQPDSSPVGTTDGAGATTGETANQPSAS